MQLSQFEAVFGDLPIALARPQRAIGEAWLVGRIRKALRLEAEAAIGPIGRAATAGHGSHRCAIEKLDAGLGRPELHGDAGGFEACGPARVLLRWTEHKSVV